MSVDNPQFEGHTEEYAHTPEGQVQASISPPTYFQELKNSLTEITAAFVTPPPSSLRGFAAYMVRDIPSIALTAGMIIGEIPVFDLINRTLDLTNPAIVNFEYLSIPLSVFPIGVLADRLTRRLRQRIDYLINPNQQK